MTDRVLTGERVVFSFHGKTLPPHVKEWLNRGLCGGIIFFGDNFESQRQFQALTSQIVEASSITPPLLMIDHEGGRVQRIVGPLLPLPSAMHLAERKSNDPDFIYRLGKRVGKGLRKLGINMNAAPVLDVLTEPSNRVIGDRALGTEPGDVTRLGIGFAKGLLAENVCPVVKHFPGHGMTREDSHETLPAVQVGWSELFPVHISPFVKAIEEGLPAVMTAHVLYEQLDKELPATLSKFILQDLLRDKIGFRGIVISDDLSMEAISGRFTLDEVARFTTLSGTDILVHCGKRDAQEGLLEALSSHYLHQDNRRSDLQELHSRIRRFRKFLLDLSSR